MRMLYKVGAKRKTTWVGVHQNVQSMRFGGYDVGEFWSRSQVVRKWNIINPPPNNCTTMLRYINNNNNNNNNNNMSLLCYVVKYILIFLQFYWSGSAY
jgi:hypothetical protein